MTRKKKTKFTKAGKIRSFVTKKKLDQDILP